MKDDSTRALTDRVAARIHEVRAEQGLSQSELSHRSGVGVRTLSELQHAARTPTLATLAKVADALGVELPVLLQQVQHRPEPLEQFADDAPVTVDVLDIRVQGDTQVEVHRVHLTGPVRQGPLRKGARGYITVTDGQVSAGSASTPRAISVGGQLAFAADQPHVLVPAGDSAELVLVMRYPASE